MTGAPIERIDFSEPRGPSTPASQGLKVWLRDACALIREYWGVHLSEPPTLQLVRTSSALVRDALKNVDDPGFGTALCLGAPAMDAMISMPLQLAVALVGDLLGTESEEQPEARGLTDLEVSMLQLLFQELARGLSEAWPGDSPVPCHACDVIGRPRRSRLFPTHTVLLVVHVQVQSPSGTGITHWLIPQEPMEALISAEWLPEEPPQPTPDPRLQELVRGVPVELTVELGRAQLTMTQLADLERGDVVLLDQRIGQPLTALVDGSHKWTGWPGRSGTRQLYCVESVIGDALS